MELLYGLTGNAIPAIYMAQASVYGFFPIYIIQVHRKPVFSQIDHSHFLFDSEGLRHHRRFDGRLQDFEAGKRTGHCILLVYEFRVLGVAGKCDHYITGLCIV